MYVAKSLVSNSVLLFSAKTLSSESIKTNIGKPYQTSDETLEDICVLFFLTFLNISTTESVCCGYFKTNTFFFHILKSCQQFSSLILLFQEITTLTTPSSQTILSCPPGKMDNTNCHLYLFIS